MLSLALAGWLFAGELSLRRSSFAANRRLFTLGGGNLASLSLLHTPAQPSVVAVANDFIRETLALVGRPLTLVGQPFALVGDPLAFVCQLFAPVGRDLAGVQAPGELSRRQFSAIGDRLALVSDRFAVSGYPLTLLGDLLALLVDPLALSDHPLPLDDRATRITTALRTRRTWLLAAARGQRGVQQLLGV